MFLGKKFWLLFLSAFLFRLAFGLLRDQMWEFDQIQTYLIGLKFYTTHQWPFFGPDVTGTENQAFTSQLPGAMEGLLIGLPFFILPIPEAPFILLNLLSLVGVALLTWYIIKRLPELSYVWVFLWISVVPWSIHESTTVINPAYTFLPAILFTIGFLESLPWFSIGVWAPRWSNAAMGLSLFWIMQFHFSYVYFLPLAALSLAAQVWKDRDLKAPFYFVLGSLPSLALLIPTYWVYGLARNNVSSGFATLFHWDNMKDFFVILARFLSLVCFELPRFIGTSTHFRIQFLTDHWPLYVPGAILWIGGLLQPFLLLYAWIMELARGKKVLKPKPGPYWKNLNWLLLFVFVIVYLSFWFTIKKPLSHIYFIFFPLLMLYSCYVYAQFKNKRWAVLFAKTFIVLGILFQLGYAIAVAPKDSIYPYRDKMSQAIDQKNYHLFAERLTGSLY